MHAKHATVLHCRYNGAKIRMERGETCEKSRKWWVNHFKQKISLALTFCNRDWEGENFIYLAIDREQNFLACDWHQRTLKLSHDQGFVKEAVHCIKTNLFRVDTTKVTSFLLTSYVTAMKVFVPLSPTPTACRKLGISTQVSGKSTN